MLYGWSIIGKRLISIGDQTGSEIKDSSIFKQLTGGDAVKIEPKNRQPFYYQFTGGIAIVCNNLPSFQDDKGGHIFERLCVAPCTNTIEQERRDSALLDKKFEPPLKFNQVNKAEKSAVGWPRGKEKQQGRTVLLQCGWYQSLNWLKSMENPG